MNNTINRSLATSPEQFDLNLPKRHAHPVNVGKVTDLDDVVKMCERTVELIGPLPVPIQFSFELSQDQQIALDNYRKINEAT